MLSMERIVRNANGSFHGSETCFSAIKHSPIPTLFATFLRVPRTQVVSQFFQLKNHGGFCTLNLQESGVENGACCENFPTARDDHHALKLWLNWYTEEDWLPRSYPLSNAAKDSKHVGNYFGSCFTPWNMQSRALTCKYRKSYRACMPSDAAPDLNETLKRLNEISFVGIVEFFSESMCVFAYRLTGVLPEGCSCARNNAEEWIGAQLKSKAYHRSGGRAFEHDPSNFDAVDKLTQVDVLLYRAGLLRLVRDMKQIELETGTKVLCAKKMEKLKRESDYIPGLWNDIFKIWLPYIGGDMKHNERARVAPLDF